MDSILSEQSPGQAEVEPAEAPESDSLEADAGTEPAAETTEAPSATPGKPKVEAKPTAETAKDDDEDQESEPTDVDGFKKALAAARGDKRKARKKWQDAEKRLAQFEGELRALRQMQQPQAQPKPEEKVDEFGQFLEKPPEFVRSVARAEAQAVASQSAQAMHLMARRWMARQHTDFAEAEGAFLEAAKADPSLFAKMSQATSTGEMTQPEFAYEAGKQILRMQKLGVTSLDELEAKLREELRAEYEAKQGQPASAETPKPTARPIPKPSIATARGSGGGARQEWSGPRSLESILGPPH